MINSHSPFRPWEADHGKCFGIFDVVGDVAVALAYTSANKYSWQQAKDMPKQQAAANIEVLELQRNHYDKIINGGKYKPPGWKQGNPVEKIEGIRPNLRAAIEYYLDQVKNEMGQGKKDTFDNFEDAYPDIPKAAEYVPVDPCCEQSLTIECNIAKTTRADNYVQYVNRLHEKNDLIHALSLDPRFLVTLDIQSKSIQDLTRGILPIGDIVEVVSDSAEQASLTGRIGNTSKTAARDLGISKLRAQAAGRKEFRESIAWANTAVSPLQRQHDITEMMQTPAQRVSLALHQAQLIQQSLQNKNNALAQKKPYKLAKLQARMQRDITRLQAKSSEALLVNSHIPNYALTVTPNVNGNPSGIVGAVGQGISTVLQNGFFGAQNGYSGGSHDSAAPAYHNASDRPPGY